MNKILEWYYLKKIYLIIATGFNKVISNTLVNISLIKQN